MAIANRSISQFKSALKGGGQRPNLFEVELSKPSGVTFGVQPGTTSTNELESNKTRFLCKAASLPASNVASIDVPFRGRILKVAGDRTFESWSITVINDDFGIRDNFEAWMQAIAQYGDASGLTDPDKYMADAKVYQLGRTASKQESSKANSSTVNSSVTAAYQFIDIFPTNISAIDLSYENTDTIEEFTVDFSVQYWFPANERYGKQS